MNGFTTAVAARSTVQLQQTTRVDFTLNPGAVNQEVNVTDASPLVQSTTSDLGQVIDSRQIESLPLNGRLFEKLVTITPGAVQVGFGDFAENPSAAGSVSASMRLSMGCRGQAITIRSTAFTTPSH